MEPSLQLPLDSKTVEKLQKFGKDLIRNKDKREAFLKKRKATLAEYGLESVDLSKLDGKVVEMLADPAFNEAVKHKDIEGIRAHVQRTLGDRLTRGDLMGTFDFDFDVEVEVEVVVVAIAVFDFAARVTRIPDPAELQRRRAIVAEALGSLRR
jgi:hypothetical protein